jgi:hypothetical protein
VAEDSLGQLEEEVREALEDLHHARTIPNPARRSRRIIEANRALLDIRDRARFAEVEDDIDRFIGDQETDV